MKKYLLLTIILISLLGIVMIYSSSSIWSLYKYNDAYKYVRHQIIFLIIGLIIMTIISKIDYHLYLSKDKKIILSCIILLILVLIPGLGTIRNGSRSWFGIGSFGIQPSEFAKIGIIIFTSSYVSKNKIKTFKDIIGISLLTLAIFALIMLQPDFGTGTILVMSVIGILFIAGMNIKFFIIAAIIGLLGVTALIIIAPYRLTRILSFLNPWSDPLGSGFQIIQSLYAIGPGGLFGYGFGNSRQKHFFLPEPQTDFIFSIISEELGFIGCLIVVLLFAIIGYLGFKISRKSNDLFGKYLSFGLTFQLIFQAVLNLMVVTGLIPVTGVTLPFLSYGGSSLLVSLISMGILLNVSNHI